jgi:alkanesulfonate monooxygenase SsuD/methylene tetrahydromethanopterin reductase-like flavin-dependent oxidoreductase (luciferase family)
VQDPVRVYQDLATVDLISRGRAEITVGRSAFIEPFALFGYDISDYGALFAEKLDLLLQTRSQERVSWSGRHRPALTDAAIFPRAMQDPLPVWVGVGGTVSSAERAGQLGLPMTLGYIGGTLANLHLLVDAYRAAGDRAGHPGKLRLGLSTHLYAGADPAAARAVYPHFYEYLRPKTPGDRGFTVSPAAFEAATSRESAMIDRQCRGDHRWEVTDTPRAGSVRTSIFPLACRRARCSAPAWHWRLGNWTDHGP